MKLLLEFNKLQIMTDSLEYTGQGHLNNMPLWVDFLLRSGKTIASNRGQERWTLALCLPRLHYAALFCALGVMQKRTEGVTSVAGFDRLQALVGHWVSFNHGPQTRQGKLVAVDAEKVEAKVLIHNGRQMPDFENMTLEDRIRFNPPARGALTAIVAGAQCESIAPLGREYARGGRSNPLQNSEREDLRFWFPAAVDHLLTTNQIHACLIGNKARLTEEMQSPVRLKNGVRDLTLGSLLRPDSMPRYKDSPHVHLATPLDLSASNPGHQEAAWIIEAAGPLGDILQQTRAHNRVLLLARSSRRYPEYVESLNNAYRMRKGDMVADFFPAPAPAHINLLAFQHA